LFSYSYYGDSVIFLAVALVVKRSFFDATTVLFDRFKLVTSSLSRLI
jgi:hypothetical protein